MKRDLIMQRKISTPFGEYLQDPGYPSRGQQLPPILPASQLGSLNQSIQLQPTDDLVDISDLMLPDEEKDSASLSSEMSSIDVDWASIFPSQPDEKKDMAQVFASSTALVLNESQILAREMEVLLKIKKNMEIEIEILSISKNIIKKHLESSEKYLKLVGQTIEYYEHDIFDRTNVISSMEQLLPKIAYAKDQHDISQSSNEKSQNIQKVIAVYNQNLTQFRQVANEFGRVDLQNEIKQKERIEKICAEQRKLLERTEKYCRLFLHKHEVLSVRLDKAKTALRAYEVRIEKIKNQMQASVSRQGHSASSHNSSVDNSTVEISDGSGVIDFNLIDKRLEEACLGPPSMSEIDEVLQLAPKHPKQPLLSASKQFAAQASLSVTTQPTLLIPKSLQPISQPAAPNVISQEEKFSKQNKRKKASTSRIGSSSKKRKTPPSVVAPAAVITPARSIPAAAITPPKLISSPSVAPVSQDLKSGNSLIAQDLKSFLKEILELEKKPSQKEVIEVIDLEAEEQKENKALNDNRFDPTKYKRLNTAGGGNCAFHAILGHWNPQENKVICPDPEDKRKNIASAIRNKDPRLMKGIKDGIYEIVMSEEWIGPATKLLGENYQRCVAQEKLAQPGIWKSFKKKLKKYSEITKYVDENTLAQKDKPVRERFLHALNVNDGRLYELINDTPELSNAFKEYNNGYTTKFNWDANLTQEVFNEYANHFNKRVGWLLPSELWMIAEYYGLTIEYFTAETATPDLFNPGHPVVSVLFNGRDHYEQLLVLSQKAQPSVLPVSIFQSQLQSSSVEQQPLSYFNPQR